MNTKRMMRWVIVLFLLATLPVMTAVMAQEQEPDSLTYTFTAPAFSVETDGAGSSTVTLEGFYPYALPGDPLLPASLTHIALPPFVPIESVSIEIVAVQQRELPGVHQIEPAGPAVAAPEGRPPAEDWGPNAKKIVDGQNTAVYGKAAYFPAAPVELVQVSQMRKWRYVTLRYYPVSFNPGTHRLRLTTEVSVAVHFQPGIVDAQAQLELNDTAFDDQAASMLANYADMQADYAPVMQAPAAAPGYAIITTNQIASVSRQLTSFISHKQALGFNVFLVTETDYNPLKGQAPNERPDKIRKWLKANYLTKNIQYVLLIGGPDPADPGLSGDVIGDLPMKQTWIYGWNSVDSNGDRGTPTDFYYADLTGNWNKDGDQYYGDSGDYVAGGVDWAAEVYVGRIPVYTYTEEWAWPLDNILQRIITYEVSTDRDWRRSALLPMSFLGLGADAGLLGEYMRNDYLLDAGFSTYRMYWQDPTNITDCDSVYDSEAWLLHEAAPNYWKNHPFGIVAMYGHGWEGGISIGWNSCESGPNPPMNGMALMLSGNATMLNGDRPALVAQLSCSTGLPEAPDNLGAMILNYGAVGTVAASRISYGWASAPSPGDNRDSSFGYYYMKNIVNDMPAGRALFNGKATPTDSWNALVMNLYGDPSVQLFRNPPAGIVVESEPNNTMGQANTAQLGDVVSGAMSQGGDVDFYKVHVEQWGTAILVDTDARSEGSPANTVITLYNSGGTDIGSNDDSGEPDTPDWRDSMLYRVVPPGWYYVKVREFSNGSGAYTLMMTSPLLISAASNVKQGSVDGIPFAHNDILAYSKLNTGEDKWAMFLDASDVGITNSLVNLSTGWVATDGSSTSIAISFGTNQVLTDYQGIPRTFKPWDWAILGLDQVGPQTQIGHIEHHAGTDHGLTTAGEKLDALSIEDYWNSPDPSIDIRFSTVGAATVPGPGLTAGKVKLADEDLFRSSLEPGWNAFRNWGAFDGSTVPGLSTEDVFAADYDPHTGDYYLTILGTGTIEGHKVAQNDIFRVTYPTGRYYWDELVWHGPDHGWNYNIDAFDYPVP